MSLLPAWTEGVSIVLPVCNASGALPDFFSSLAESDVLEVLVCDCDSTDESVAIARNAGAHIFRGEGSTADIINNAIRHARGTALWFLLPEARPTKVAGPYILGALEEPGYLAGWWPVALRKDGKSQTMVSWRKNAAARALHWVLPEHGFFLDRELFDSLGGFPHGRNPLPALARSVAKKTKLFAMSESLVVEL